VHPADRSGVRMRLPAHESTTAQLGAAYPFVASPPLPTAGLLIGQDLTGGPFAHEPVRAVRGGRGDKSECSLCSARSDGGRALS
jgi:hypothetical protein